MLFLWLSKGCKHFFSSGHSIFEQFFRLFRAVQTSHAGLEKNKGYTNKAGTNWNFMGTTQLESYGATYAHIARSIYPMLCHGKTVSGPSIYI
jgi:hypothetical protein